MASTVGVRLMLCASHSGTCGNGYLELAESAGDLLDDQPVIQVDVKALRKQNFIAKWTDAGTSLKRRRQRHELRRAA